MLRRTLLLGLGLILLSGCVTSQNAGSGAKSLALKPGDAPSLAGVWKGEYVMDNGYAGQTKLTVGDNGDDKVTGVFEYFWDGGNQSRYPKRGSVNGEIGGAGSLDFGPWILRAYRSGNRVTLKTRQKIGGNMSDIYWSKDVARLKSEAGKS